MVLLFMRLLQDSKAVSNVPRFDVRHLLYLLVAWSSKVRG